MKLKTLLIINAVFMLWPGIKDLLKPEMQFSLFGIEQSPSGLFIGRCFGMSLIAIGLLSWFARNVEDTEAQQAIILAFLISDIIGVILCIFGTLNGLMSSFGWVAVGKYLFLSLGFAYFYFKNRN